MAEKTAGEKIQILKKIERGQRTARPGEEERGCFWCFGGISPKRQYPG